ncbi:MAG: methyltransferase domain-containing protein [Kiritimatiellae bacterium]|nr:methyltransferase domain-containing protein [Kiritimatiellia bacterium]MCO5068312.1 methyltransferase domain-containing protein [Kiritimatiellia bacterium]
MNEQNPNAFPETADIETASANYAARFAGKTGAWMLARQERIALDFLQSANAKTILDVGGGHGQLARPMAHAGFDVTVLGSDPVCQERIADLVSNERCKFIVGNVVQLPFPDRSFDAAVSVRLLPHCERWPSLIRELCRVARHTVVVDYPLASGMNTLAPWLFDAKKRLEKNTRTWRNFTHAEVRNTFQAAGFQPISRRGQFFWPMVIHRSLKSPAISNLLEAVPGGLGITARFGTPVLAAFTRAQ